jgi:hypothetical protein
MSYDAKYAIFRKWARRPSSTPNLGEPVMRPVMLNVGWVNECDQDIDIQEKPGQFNSSRN